MRRFLAFCLVGGVSTIVSYVCFLGLLNFVHYALAYTIAYAVGIVVSYIANATFVFKRKLELKTALTYPLTYVVQFGIGIVAVALLVQWAHLPQTLAGAVTILLSAPLSFLISKFLLNKGTPRDAAPSPRA